MKSRAPGGVELKTALAALGISALWGGNVGAWAAMRGQSANIRAEDLVLSAGVLECSNNWRWDNFQKPF